MKTDNDYVLGTHDEEITRLGIQHRVWRPTVLECWQRAEITIGSRVVDIGAGPGYATVDLAEIVGPTGEVLAVDRSARFIAAASEACAVRKLANVKFQQADLMEQEIEGAEFDAAWCRWVACFVTSPGTLVDRIAKVLRPGGVALFHEYFDYGTWRVAPTRPLLQRWVEEVMESWRISGGEPDAAMLLPQLLVDSGLRVVHATPRIFAITRRDFMWQWPATFVAVNTDRLVASGRITSEWAESLRSEFREAQEDPATILMTPLVLEIIAQRE